MSAIDKEMSIFNDEKQYTAVSANLRKETLKPGTYVLTFDSVERKENQRDGTEYIAIDYTIKESTEPTLKAGSKVRHTLNLPEKAQTPEGKMSIQKLQKFLLVVVGEENKDNGKLLAETLSKILAEPKLLAGKDIKAVVKGGVAKGSGREYINVEYYEAA